MIADLQIELDIVLMYLLEELTLTYLFDLSTANLSDVMCP